jgi:hypothetical protein
MTASKRQQHILSYVATGYDKSKPNPSNLMTASEELTCTELCASTIRKTKNLTHSSPLCLPTVHICRKEILITSWTKIENDDSIETKRTHFLVFAVQINVPKINDFQISP